METTALSLSKSVLSGALRYAKSALAKEVALQLGVQQDQAFIAFCKRPAEKQVVKQQSAVLPRQSHRPQKVYFQIFSVSYTSIG
jgi:uncharacterized protein (DUF1778 family)